MIDYYTHPEDRIDEIELEILTLDKLHLKTTRYLERLEIPEINNSDVEAELVDLFHNLQYGLTPILEAIADLKVERGLIYDKIQHEQEWEKSTLTSAFGSNYP